MKARPEVKKIVGQITLLGSLIVLSIQLISWLNAPGSVQANDRPSAAAYEGPPGQAQLEPDITPTAAVRPTATTTPTTVEPGVAVEPPTTDTESGAEPGVQSDQDREVLLRRAASDAFVRQFPAETEFEIGLIKIVDEWALVNFRVTSADETAAPPGWDVHLGLARWNDMNWDVVLESSGDFQAWLGEIPAELLPIEARSFLEPEISLASDAPGLLLPFPIGQTWKYLAGPYGGPRREAVDFGPFGVDERITPEPPPTNPLTGRERDVTAAAAGLVIDKGANYLVLRHAGFPIWETGYNSLAAASNIRQIGDIVKRGERIGSASGEVEPIKDDYVQFWVRRRGVDQVIDGQVLSEWQVYQDNGLETGQNAGRLVYKTGIERVDCVTVERNNLDPEACHVKHFSVMPSPLATSTVVISPSGLITIPVGLTGLTTVLVEDTNNLFRVDLRLSYSPASAVRVIDAFPGTPGIQVAPGKIFEDQPATFIRNRVNPKAGIIEFEADLQVPAFSFTGSSSLIEITWFRKSPGEVGLKLEKVRLADPNGRKLPVVLSAGDEIKIQSGFLLSGQVELQGRDQWDNVTVASADQQVKTDAGGGYLLGVAGPYQLSLTAPGYLSARTAGDPDKSLLSENETIEVSRVKLLGGDVIGDDQIDIFDLSFIASRYGGSDERADITGDGTVDIFDLTLPAANFGQRGPITTRDE